MIAQTILQQIDDLTASFIANNEYCREQCLLQLSEKYKKHFSAVIAKINASGDHEELTSPNIILKELKSRIAYYEKIEGDFYQEAYLDIKSFVDRGQLVQNKLLEEAYDDLLTWIEDVRSRPIPWIEDDPKNNVVKIKVFDQVKSHVLNLKKRDL